MRNVISLQLMVYIVLKNQFIKRIEDESNRWKKTCGENAGLSAIWERKNV